MTAYDLYKYLDAAMEYYLDCIAIKEDPTEKEREQYEYLNYWKPSEPDDEVKEILRSIVLINKEKQGNVEEK